MSLYGFFAAPTLGMMAQSSAFGSISQNITNLNTGGYKATDTRFSTVLASTFDTNSDVGGVQAYSKTNVTGQGRTLSTNNSLDVSINGKGMFVLNSELGGGGETLFSRDGAFEVATPVLGSTTVGSSTFSISEGYLVDKNGYFVQGWEPDSNGNFTASSSTTSMRVDRFAYTSDPLPTTTAIAAMNLPAAATPGTVHTAPASVYDANGDLQSLAMQWTKLATPQTWQLEIVPTNGTNVTTPTTTETFTFDGNGLVPNGTSHSFDNNWNGGQTSSITLDISDVTSIGTQFIYNGFERDGRVTGELNNITFDQDGHVVGNFSNGTQRNLYKLALATFISPDRLEARQGNLFAVSTASGEPEYREADVEGFATFTPFSHELSNTNLSAEFTKMIMVQQAYNSSASVFKTVDEMTRVASQLKS